MTVETRFVVIRNGQEVETFVDRKEADNYDKMLDMAEFIADLLEKSPVELTEQQRESLGIYLAKRREELLAVLQPKKVKPKTDESA
ncbi:DNA damage-inducible protein YebG [Legionella massiliensis]|uniref:DNA damage-inducible protein YebG n=1 Tax=Legionella massiliensis TaxID=1034943 RepID=A0A078KZM1_9GAMM|nr:YebG family protein [Legionella massiliensis]CDZ77249.1 DNA damage-inducible protein YebG [Legionella massiliensis]CEE12987.1 DNA damage-inducible protein YebG [Legionella massiliensis]